MKNNYEIFPKAPIREAMMDIRIEFPDASDISLFGSYHNKVKQDYPSVQKRYSFSGRVEVSAEEASFAEKKHRHDGFLFRSESGDKIVQSRIDGFTFNKLKPYENWTIFKEEGISLWNKFYELIQPAKITRIALRYINCIEMPMPITNFNQYVLTFPEIAPNIPQGLSEFFIRLVIPNNKNGSVAIIHETMEKPTPNNILPFIFDIDVYKMTSFTNNNIDIINIFDSLREYKNEIFFNSITEKAKELFR